MKSVRDITAAHATCDVVDSGYILITTPLIPGNYETLRVIFRHARNLMAMHWGELNGDERQCVSADKAVLLASHVGFSGETRRQVRLVIPHSDCFPYQPAAPGFINHCRQLGETSLFS